MTARRILFVTAELRPLVSVGGLGEASAGLVEGLRKRGHHVDVVIPDYGGWVLEGERRWPLDVPDWAGPATARHGIHERAGEIIVIDAPGLARPNPYVDGDGQGWPDNTRRFAAFSAAAANLVADRAPDLVHLNDWHTGLVPAFLPEPVPLVLTIHNLAHQGWAPVEWVHRLPRERHQYVHDQAMNPLAGAIRTAELIVAVSPTYAAEIRSGEGMGLDGPLADRATAVIGIRNGIDVGTWNPACDLHLPEPFGPDDFSGKRAARRLLLSRLGWPDDPQPIIAMVTRMVEQKGVDVALDGARYLPGIGARLAILGTGDRLLTDRARAAADAHPDRVWFADGYDVELSHLLFAGSDLLLMPSRFEPCGLSQMQAMAYGTIPVVTGVGGLADTVVDADRHRGGNGFVAVSNDLAGMVDALHRAVHAWTQGPRRRILMRRGMSIDWSWEGPAGELSQAYERVLAGR